MWKGVELMKFKVGDEVRVVNAPVGLPEGEPVGEIHKVTLVDNGKIPYELSNRYWCREDDLEPIEDPLVTKIEERNNKPVKMISGENLLNENDPIKPAHYRKGEIDLYESWYRTYPFNEFRAIMSAIAERYMKRDKDNRIQDLNKAIYTLSRLKEYEELEK